MLLADLQKATEIDNEIKGLHAQLISLYETRLALTRFELETDKSPIKDNWSYATYTDLKNLWATKNIAIPSFNSLKAKLSKAQSIIGTIDNDLALRDTFGVLLVPPTSVYDAPSTTINDLEDFKQASSQTKSWKLFVVYMSTQGFKIDNRTNFIVEDSMVIAGYKMPGLNLYQYNILTGLSSKIYDENEWSILRREMNPSFDVLCVANISNTYRCAVDNIRNLIGNNRFRPAMEVR